MDDDDLMKLLIRGWALFCATQGPKATSGSDATARAENYEAYLKGEED